MVKAALESCSSRVIAVYQPHRYTRTLALLHDFPRAFTGLAGLVLAPVYAASEAPLRGGTSADLLAVIEDAGTVRACGAESLDVAWTRLQTMRQPGDLVLILGAGDIEQLAFRPWPSVT